MGSGPYNLAAHSIAVIVAAAGKGTRMGEMPKLLLPLPLAAGKPLVRHTVEAALRLQPLVTVVVVRPDLPEVEACLADLPVRCVPNPRYMEGLGSSLAVGVAALGEEVGAVLALLGDMPSVDDGIFGRLIAAYLKERKAITIPSYGGQYGPPTIFSREAFPLLAGLLGDTGGRQLVERFPQLCCVVPFEEAERPEDVDTPQDYRALL